MGYIWCISADYMGYIWEDLGNICPIMIPRPAIMRTTWFSYFVLVFCERLRVNRVVTTNLNAAPCEGFIALAKTQPHTRELLATDFGPNSEKTWVRLIQHGDGQGH